MQFVSELMAGDPVALLIVAAVLIVALFVLPNRLKRSKEDAEIARFGAEADTAHLNSRAAKKGLHPSTIPQINLLVAEDELGLRRVEHDADIAGKAKWEERRQALEAIRLAQLDQHRSIESLRGDLKRLHREEYATETGDDPESVKLKDLKVIRTLISGLERDLNGRIRRLVQDADGKDVGRVDPDFESGGNNSAEAQRGSEPVSTPRNRVGF